MTKPYVALIPLDVPLDGEVAVQGMVTSSSEGKSVMAGARLPVFSVGDGLSSTLRLKIWLLGRVLKRR